MDIGPGTQPLTVFEEWLKEANLLQLHEPNAMTLATVNASGEPHTRVVLCKHWSPEGFVFFTNYQSRKGADIDANPNVAAVFYWGTLARQIAIEGRVEKVERQVSVDYWATRPRESQLSGYISKQSRPAPGREELERAWTEAEEKFKGREIPCPDQWGGYLLRPKTIEFWVGRPGRLHDRHVFDKTTAGWTYRRLYP